MGHWVRAPSLIALVLVWVKIEHVWVQWVDIEWVTTSLNLSLVGADKLLGLFALCNVNNAQQLHCFEIYLHVKLTVRVELTPVSSWPQPCGPRTRTSTCKLVLENSWGQRLSSRTTLKITVLFIIAACSAKYSALVAYKILELFQY